ncbi:MAG TPA: carboxypeptidase regulatory-like domain-containing protein, partial [Planctomycetaceae bacterium]|nr:carboxypeptidase regulatory-like domain-containing protein [Planctomycetaceae bacterium]
MALDLTLRSPATVTGTVRGPDGKPLVGYSLSDKSSFFEEASRRSRQTVARFEINGATFEIKVFSPTDRHRLMFYHRSRNLVGYREFIGEPSGPLDITLEPAATLKGRLVDDGGQPLGDVSLVIAARQAVASENRSTESKEAVAAGPQLDQSQITTDKDGRFELRRVLPGLAYSAVAQGAITSQAGHRIPGGAVFTNILAGTGETRELGELRIAFSEPKQASEPARAKAASPPKEQSVDVNVIRGRVLRPDGKPAAGAKVLVLRQLFTVQVKRTPFAKTTAGPNGEFTLRLRKIQPADAMDAGGGLSIAAEAKGFGAEWRLWGPRDVMSGEIVLKLVPEVPIHGRIVDLEGKPVGGVRVDVLWQNKIDDNFKPWLQEVKAADDSPFRQRLRRPVLQMPGYDDESQPPIVTDRDGRFTLTGIGADNVARLVLRGETIAHAALDLVAHSIEPVTLKGESGETSQLFGADVRYQAAPTQPIVGTVRDAVSGAPLAGVTIESDRLADLPLSRGLEGVVRAVTDVQGKYRLIGRPKGEGGGRGDENLIGVIPKDDQPYFALNRVKVP